MSKRPKKSANRSQRSQLDTSQRTVRECFDKETENINNRLKENIQKFVRYVILRGGSNQLIKRQEIVKNVFTNSGDKSFKKVLEEGSKILKEVYGYKLELCEMNSEVYAVVNLVTPIITEEDMQNGTKKIIALLVLSHIFMSNNSCSDTSLYAFLKKLNIDVTQHHEVFGNVNDYINKTMVKQKLLIIETNTLLHKSNFKWGPKADVSISKMEILKFVNKIMNKNLIRWEDQYGKAMEQHRLYFTEQQENEDEENVD